MIQLLTTQHAEQYRTLRLKALQTDANVYQSTYDTEGTQPISFFIQTLHNTTVPPIFGYYGYFEHDQLVGYLQLEYLWSPKRQHIAKLTNLYVDPEFRGQGIGTKLFNHLTELAKKHGIEQLTLQCNASNASAIKLYEKQGFEEYGRKKKGLKWNGHYDDIVLMSKYLE